MYILGMYLERFTFYLQLGTNAPTQSGIKSDDRQIYDLIDDEIDCFLEHCPWAPTVDLSREIKDLPLSVCLMLNLPTTANGKYFIHILKSIA